MQGEKIVNNILVSIIIVDFNSGDLITKCVKSIKESIKIKYEIIIVDNNSAVEHHTILKRLETSYDKLKVIYLGENVGFAKANNIGSKYAQGKYYHFLNPDTKVGRDLNDFYVEIIKNDVYKMYATTLYEGEKLVSTGHKMETISNYLFRKNQRWYIGASLIMNRKLFYKIGMWPEDYFMYSEDMDLCYLCWEKGYSIELADVHIEHLGGGTTSKCWSAIETDIKKEVALIKFYRKHKLVLDYIVRKMYKLLKRLFFNKDEFDYCLKVQIEALKRIV